MRRDLKCSACRFYESFGNERGVCRGAPPLVDGNGRTVWPQPMSGDWCAKHEVKE